MSGVTKRLSSGRGHWYKLDGEKVDGVTTVIGNGVPKPALAAWAAKMAAEFTADNLSTLATFDRATIIDTVKGAPWRDRDAAANRGTEVHNLAEKLQRGEEIDVPEALTGHVDSYIDFVETTGWTPEVIEAVVINRRYKYMGTLDGIGTLPKVLPGKRALIDIKTNRSGVFGEVALQLSAYRFAEHYLSDGVETPMPPIDFTGVVWIRADGWDLVPVNTDETTFLSFRHAQLVAKFCANAKAGVYVGDTIASGAPS